LNVAQLAELLRLWDLIKFAQSGSSVAEAEGAEAAVESMLRSASAPPRQEVA
jgi:hypothetical protein